jgi:pimeloyl-ACP methyl ester carboxylesterase
MSDSLDGMKKRWKVLAAVVVGLVALLGIAWALVVPEPLKQIIVFEMWRGSNMRASGSVDREPPGTYIVWQEYGKADGPPVVVLHGGFGSITLMGPQIRALAPTRRVLAIDSRGHGQSTNTGATLTYEMMTDDVIGVMDARKIARADIVGESDGANIALDLARRYRDRVGKVIAYGATYTNKGIDEKFVEELRSATADVGWAAPMKFMYEHNNPDPTHWPVFFEQVKSMILTEPNWTQEQLATIRASVLLVNGEHDLVLLSHAMEIKGAIRGARLEIIPDAPHEAPLSNPDAVNALTLAFLNAP